MTSPTLLLIGGLSRSGTTLLWRICDGHPEIRLTFQFRNFLLTDRTPLQFAAHAARTVLDRDPRAYSLLGPVGRPMPWNKIGTLLRGNAMAARYLAGIARRPFRKQTLDDHEAATRALFPTARIVGDKDPGYQFSLDRLPDTARVHYVMIYRDCRDVAASMLERMQAGWSKQPWAAGFSTAAKIAEHWVKVIEINERNRDRIQLVRYEDFARDPAATVDELARRLGVDAAGFPTHIAHTASIGRYRQRLSADQIADVERVAGTTMKRLGYLTD